MAVDSKKKDSSTKKTTSKAQLPVKQKEVKKKTPAKKKPARAPKPPGRKPWLPDYGKIENWASQGLKDNEMAALSGVCYQLFSEKKNEINEEHPEEMSKLKEAIELGKAKGTAAASQKLLSLALSGSERSLHFYLERISGRKNTIVFELPKKPIHEMTDQEIQDALDGKQID